MIEANATILRDVISKAKNNPVVIDFYAAWCEPCQLLNPLFNNVSVSHGANATFVKINVDDNADLAELYQIRALPTIVVIKNNSESTRRIGVPSHDAFIKMFT